MKTSKIARGSVRIWWGSHALPAIGAPLSLAKRWWILAIATFLSAIIVGLNATKVLADDEGLNPSWLTTAAFVSAIAIAVSAFADKIADAYDSYLQEQRLAVAEDTAEASVDALRDFVAKCAKVESMTPKLKKSYVQDGLRDFMTIAAVQGYECGARASYYTLTGAPGSRELVDPVHGLTNGRRDQPYRPFIEAEAPDNTIWRTLERADTEPEVVKYPDDRDGVNWDKADYKEYLTVPVRHGNHVFGILSVNASVAGATSGSQRAVIVSLARSFAFAAALSSDTRSDRPSDQA